MSEARGAEETVLRHLRRQARGVRFVSELTASLAAGAAAVERALVELEGAGAVIVREQYCADPHLEGTDLRIVAAVENAGDAEAQLQALKRIDAAWREWLATYMANHRCG